jgi:hypothetical protein
VVLVNGSGRFILSLLLSPHAEPRIQWYHLAREG